MPQKIAIIDPQFSDDLDLERSLAGDAYVFQLLHPERGDVSHDRLADADAIIHCRSRNKMNAELIRVLDNVKIVVQAGVGVNHIDIAACSARGIPVCNVPDYGTREIADHAIALLLNLRRGIAAYDERVRASADGWSPFVLALAPVHRLAAQTLGIVGLGAIGAAVALRAKAFGMNVVFYDPLIAPGVDLSLGITRVESLDELWAVSDSISLHCPLTDATRNLVGRATIARMKPGVVLINTSRGEVVDLNALEDGLRSGRIGAAGLDVTPIEPPDRSHPLVKAWIDREPWLEGRLLVTPHAAFFSPESVLDLRRLALKTVMDYLATGALRACVNRRELT
ncbi:dehydrogenase, D-3- phosphoglycerate dehydrogenase-like [Burkholderia pseudomallei]|uniref:C-terminal binding protein n=1 Tax=Burkholderia pseudomallei TaxID=28450 RepID=UPI000F08B216|nr:C-terminal binding protein [Burkholderia pseudomallei]VBT33834.1 dehydrogenase, D-3- phosphoglycerate dehydrogenase-like [Burkholderia pseudomallei]